jgi:hypothetical protein
MSVVSSQNGEHYLWGDNCDGWHLAKSPNLSEETLVFIVVSTPPSHGDRVNA